MGNQSVDEQSVPQNFCALSAEYASWDASKVVVLPVPYDLTTSYQPGARRGPAAIIEASAQLELYDDELATEPYQVGIHTLAPLGPVVSGPDAMAQRTARALTPILKAGKFPVVLGGDHAVTHGVIQAIQNRHDEFSVLQLDAHADLRDTYQGSQWSHATVGRRISERAHLVQLGVRSFSSEEAAHLKQPNVNVTSVLARTWHDAPQTVEAALDQLQDPVYITIDLDVFDPSIMPATGTPEPGGLNWYQVLAVLKRVFERHTVMGCDVVELAPLPGMVAPDFLAAKLVYKLIGYWQMATK